MARNTRPDISGRRGNELAAAPADEILANVSHELRTPLGGILACTELMRSGPLSPELERSTEIIERCGRRLAALVEDLLDLTGADMLPVESGPTAFDLHDLLDTMRRQLVVRAAGRGLAVHCDLQPDVPDRVAGQPYRLRRALTHLLDNAVKFTEHGAVGLAAAVIARDAGRVTLRFTVSDTGIGIADEHQERIFAPFVQADGSTTRRYGGAGMGLAICKRAVAAMDGRLELTSRPGEGSAFSITARFATTSPTLTRQRSPDRSRVRSTATFPAAAPPLPPSPAARPIRSARSAPGGRQRAPDPGPGFDGTR
jgi:signal transduction histidine kinase